MKTLAENITDSRDFTRKSDPRFPPKSRPKSNPLKTLRTLPGGGRIPLLSQKSQLPKLRQHPDLRRQPPKLPNRLHASPHPASSGYSPSDTSGSPPPAARSAAPTRPPTPPYAPSHAPETGSDPRSTPPASLTASALTAHTAATQGSPVHPRQSSATSNHSHPGNSARRSYAFSAGSPISSAASATSSIAPRSARIGRNSGAVPTIRRNSTSAYATELREAVSAASVRTPASPPASPFTTIWIDRTRFPGSRSHTPARSSAPASAPQ